MEIIRSIIENEFTVNGYSKKNSVLDLNLFMSDNGSDYWLVSYGYYDIKKQVELFQELQKLSEQYSCIEKNTSLLLVINAEMDKNFSVNNVHIENDKAFFKKYVLPFYPIAAKQLRSVMSDNGYKSISDMLMNNDYFTNVRDQSDDSSYEYLLYSLSHKLTFIPIKPTRKKRAVAELSFDDTSLSDELEWVNNAPTSEDNLQNYILSFVNRKIYEEGSY